MGKLRPRVLVLVALAMLVAACNSDEASPASSSTTTTTAAPVTTEAQATTTTEAHPCGGHSFCVVYEISADAVWSDGTELSAEDFVHTLDALIDPVSGLPDQTGYDLIANIDVLDEKSFVVAFSRVFPSWKTLFDFVLPAHADGGFSVEGTPVSGPFVLDEWIEGERIVLRRNPAYWPSQELISGMPLGDVQELIFVFPDDVRDQLQGLQNGEIDVIIPRPLDWMIEDLETMDTVSYELIPGSFWEHIDFNHDDPLLGQPWVREAIALAIDREAILDETVRTVDPDAPVLDSAIFLTNSTFYHDNYDHVYDPARAEAMLEEKFCERGDDGIYDCQGRRMSFTWATTVGDEYRDEIFELVAQSLEPVGIELTLQPFTPSELFASDVLFGGPDVWQMINFSWKGEADPFRANTTFQCSGDAPSGFGSLNVNRYCNETVESLIRSTNRLIDPGERIAAYREADAIYLADRAIIPLFQKPALLAHDSSLSGPEANVSSSTDLWNVSAWTGSESVVIALESEPDGLDPIRPGSDSARIVLSAMLHGAFGINPSLDYQPVLASDAQPLVTESQP